MSTIEIKQEEIQAVLSDFKGKIHEIDDAPTANQIAQSSMPSLLTLKEMENDLDSSLKQFTDILIQLETDIQMSITSLQESDQNVSAGIQSAAGGPR